MNTPETQPGGTVPAVPSGAIVRQLTFVAGIPTDDGYYLVELDQPGLSEERPYDVDYCREKSPSDGGGREWVKWYPHNVRRWAALPNTGYEPRDCGKKLKP